MGRLSCQIISICPSVHLSILSRKGVDFPVRLFLSVHLSILSREGVDFPASIFLSVRLSICPFFKDRRRLLSDYLYLSVCPSVHCQKTWVDFPVRLFLSVHSFKRGGRLSSQIISICLSVHSFKRGGRFSSQFILSVHS